MWVGVIYGRETLGSNLQYGHISPKSFQFFAIFFDLIERIDCKTPHRILTAVFEIKLQQIQSQFEFRPHFAPTKTYTNAHLKRIRRGTKYHKRSIKQRATPAIPIIVNCSVEKLKVVKRFDPVEQLSKCRIENTRTQRNSKIWWPSLLFFARSK